MNVGDMVRAPTPEGWNGFPLEKNYYGWEGKVGILLKFEDAYGKKNSRAKVLISETGQVCTFVTNTLTVIQKAV
tara:strand:+ start:264 stop:485 length:222 start_codon:yes stop_codon:yes gene_type:complete